MKKIIISILIVGVILAVFAVVNNNRTSNFVVQEATITKPEIVSYTSACRSSSAPPVSEKPFGISIVPSYSSEEPPYSPEYFELLSELGVKWVRAEFYWSEIERADGTYDWSASDAFVKEMHKRGISVLAAVNYVPRTLEAWSDIRTHFELFSRALGERYKPNGVLAREEGWQTYGVRYWEIFNEPNLPGYGWLFPGSDARGFVGEYTTLLAIANKSLRESDPPALIVLAGLSPDGMPYGEFLKEFYGYQPQKCFDIFAFHPYGKSDRFPQVAKELRDLMSLYGDKGKELWFGEFGSGSDEDRESSMRKVFEERSSVDGFFWFTLRDLKKSGWNFGLVEYDFSKKPEFEIFKQLMSGINGK